MTQQDQTGSGGSPRQVRYRGRHLPMVAVIVAATIATALAYSGMVLFGLEVAHMSPLEAYGLAGFLEVSLVAVALMARNAALEGRPYGVLLTLTWVLSGTSGVFAALHEIAVPTESTPYMVVFRFVPPLVAALMWHLALVGERHMVTGHTLDERRRETRVHAYVTALEQWRDARADSSGSSADLRKVRAAHQRQRAARDGALKLLTVEDFERRMQVWVDRLEAAERHGTRLDLIGASSVKRGTARGRAETAAATPSSSAARSGTPVAPRPAHAPEPARDAETREVEYRAAEVRPAVLAVETPAVGTAVVEAPAVETPAVEGTATEPEEKPYVPETAFEALPNLEARVKEVFGRRTGPLPWDQPTPEVADTARVVEPPAVTGHTRRVEVFDLARPVDGVPGAPARVDSLTDADRTDDVDRAADANPADDPTAERDRRIVELARTGLNQREIAEQVSASRSTVSRVVRRYEDQKPVTDDRELANA
ncbi:helix-turn-helix domain-containing protein [Cellulosimicrobium marinum]|uniref:helix-turn-helix domain-containing protein n=1 Tax=Cellulosimicrobium marinum TaxID=1638992 RepID=UPI001E340863|nr:helix-turn-helix domain-containing protein [Cellulosimicrobium marinum]MCB7138143.1 helix-turn-helix domain-containing protein [Cellulosimicrobium marinum]